MNKWTVDDNYMLYLKAYQAFRSYWLIKDWEILMKSHGPLKEKAGYEMSIIVKLNVVQFDLIYIIDSNIKRFKLSIQTYLR